MDVEEEQASPWEEGQDGGLLHPEEEEQAVGAVERGVVVFGKQRG